jgi:predicted ferric reductase
MMRATVIWIGLTAVIVVPVFAAATSPLLAWRDPVYVVSAFAGVLALALLLVQPLLIAGFLPGLPRAGVRRLHRWIGAGLVVSVAVHVGGLWITSPPDVVDALVFASPTPFSTWGVVAMWAVFATAIIAIIRRRLRRQTWRTVHFVLSFVIVGGTIAHAILVEGTMEPVSKVVLCVATAMAALTVMLHQSKTVLKKY